MSKDEYYTRDTLLEAIESIYHYVCGGSKDKIKAMMDALLSSCEGVTPYDEDTVTPEDQECFALATQFYIGIYLPEMKRIDRRAGQLLAQFPVLQDMYSRHFDHALYNLSTQKITQERNHYLKDLEEEDEDFCPVRHMLSQNRWSFKEILHWIYRAHNHCAAFRGTCTRKIVVQNSKHISYFDVGKIFRFRNITSAVVGPEQDNEYHQDEANVCFHIFSQAGRLSQPYLPSNDQYKSEKKTVVFLPQSQFLVCKKEVRDQVTHIYLRELQLGFGKHVTLWLDDTVYNTRNYKSQKY